MVMRWHSTRGGIQVQWMSDGCNQVAAAVQTDMPNSCIQNAGQTEMKASYEIFRKYGRFEIKFHSPIN